MTTNITLLITVVLAKKKATLKRMINIRARTVESGEVKFFEAEFK